MEILSRQALESLTKPITLEPDLQQILKALSPTLANAEAFVEPLRLTFTRYEINSPKRQAAFLAQTMHESGGYKTLTENLNYSAQALQRTWPNRFPASVASSYARNPERIANRAYADRMGNGPEASGDGYRFRGRGLIQCTGKENYQALASHLGMPLADTVSYLETIEGACISAGWYWGLRFLNGCADRDQFEELTKRINGGTNGLEDRVRYWNHAKKLLGVDPLDEPVDLSGYRWKDGHEE